ncbi:MAG TPA: L-seryl-tRNA(Sec) selenium transferase [Anaerolineaceae bacterium]|nr:L-seryl-tRNA(Sec) selenium transferase [Anaerolineaceae bacterium]
MALTDLRGLPSVDQLLQTQEATELIAHYGRGLTLEAIRQTLEGVRASHSPGEPLPDRPILLIKAKEMLDKWVQPSLIPVVNATGVILHTNLGRAPMSAAATQAIQAISTNYSSLEYDLGRGERGSRSAHAQSLLRQITGAEAALVVNNNAAAILLVLTALARRKRVVISRTQLVEIGGGFRIPEVMAQSGARLVEVGATNRVHLSDYESALAEPAGLVFHAHHSNFRIVGFTGEPKLAEVVELAHRTGTPVVDDLGSGALIDTARFSLAHETTVQESLVAGVDLVCFSGDKLLGGPQAGIIVGKSALVAKIARHPLTRALRANKLCLAALTATLLPYLKGEAEREIPIWEMIARTPEQIRTQASHWGKVLGRGEVIAGESTIGGGSLPGETLPTFLLALAVRQPNRLLDALRQSNPPVIARIQDGRVVLDPRTVLANQEGAMLACLEISLKKMR